MRGEPAILALARADEDGVFGTCGVRARWRELGVRTFGTGRTFRELFGKSDDTYRRLDAQTRAIVLAVEALGIDQLLGDDEREAAALVTETVAGSLEVDVKYTGSLGAGLPHGAIFPYTLPSTCLGDVALRHGLRGPTVCLSVDPGERGEALREARRLFRSGEARHAIVGTVDALESARSGLEPQLRAVVLLLGPLPAGRRPVAAWPYGSGDPFARLALALEGAEGA